MAIGTYISAVDALQKAIEEADTGPLERAITICNAALDAGQKIVFFGNGGSAAMANHLAAELVGRFKRKGRLPLAGISFASDAAILTAIGNDFGVERIFAAQVRGHVNNGDVVIGLSTSGHSPNVLFGLEAAEQQGATSVLFTGRGYTMQRPIYEPQIVFWVPSDDTAHIQEAHLFFGHLLCEALDYDR